MAGALSPFRQDLLNGKVALITGGGSGINLGIARALGNHGAKVAIMGRREAVLQSSVDGLKAEGIEAFYVQGDVRDADACKKAIDDTVGHFEKLDILVNGAAGNFLCPPEDLSPNGFKTVLDIDVNGTFNMSHFAFAHLKKSKGVILNVSATLHYVGTPFQVHVSAAKAGIDAMTLNLASEWGEHGIRVVAVAPGPIGDTEGMRRLAPGEAKAAIEQTVPLRRLGKIDDIGKAAVYLVSDAASYVTGEVLVVDGGHWLSKPPMVPRAMVEKMVQATKRS